MVVVYPRLRRSVSGHKHHHHHRRQLLLRRNCEHYFNMRNNIDTQPLAAVRAQDLGRFRPVFSDGYDEKFKRMEDEEIVVQEEEYIDVIGEYPVSEPEPEVVHPKAQSLLLEQPPSKIYYDNIEKESSDGGFFDRDDLEDEDERNELVIDCKLLNGTAAGSSEEQPQPLKKKTDLRICEPPNPNPNPNPTQKFLFPPTPSTTSSTTSLEEPEVVFNFTLVDTQLVYNESKLVSPKDPTTPVISVHIPAAAAATQPPPKPSMLQQKLQQQQQQQHRQRITSQLRNLKELRTRPYGSQPRPRQHVPLSRLMPNDPRRMSSSYRMANSIPPVKRAIQQLVGGRLGGEHQQQQQQQQQQQIFGSGRVRISAFAPPKKSHYIVRDPSAQQQQRQQLPVSSRRPSVVPSYPPGSQVDKLPKNSPPPSSLPPRDYVKVYLQRREIPRTVTYLPVQFGFGSSVLSNLYDDQKPLDFSKDSPLWQYEAMLKCPREHQLRQGYHILNSMPIPKPPKPPQRAIRPKVVPMKRHPTLYLLRSRSVQPLPRLKVPPPVSLPPPTTVIDLVSPTTPPPPPPYEVTASRETFRSAMQTQIDAFFVQRQKEICTALRAFNDERIDFDQLFNQLEQLEIRYNRDYLGLAGILIKRYGCRFQATLRVDYQWSERPQDFVEYFGNLRRQQELKPRSSEATLDIYRMVVGGLLEQFRASMEHFLSNNLVVPTTTTTPK